jgi:hypothetical protein
MLAKFVKGMQQQADVMQDLCAKARAATDGDGATDGKLGQHGEI